MTKSPRTPWRVSDPALGASLRLLVEHEQYARVDIAAMFGVSSERVRQWTHQLGITYPANTPRGLRAQRVWDDAAHRFRPIRNDVVRAARRVNAAAAERAERQRARALVIADARAQLLATARQLYAESGHYPPPRALAIALDASSVASLLYRAGFTRDALAARHSLGGCHRLTRFLRESLDWPDYTPKRGAKEAGRPANAG